VRCAMPAKSERGADDYLRRLSWRAVYGGATVAAFTNLGGVRLMISLKTASFGHQRLVQGRLSSRVLGRGTIMTAPRKAALSAELEAALANYRGPGKQCPAAPPPEPELQRGRG
jgi:hypothetical protein